MGFRHQSKYSRNGNVTKKSLQYDIVNQIHVLVCPKLENAPRHQLAWHVPTYDYIFGNTATPKWTYPSYRFVVQ